VWPSRPVIVSAATSALRPDVGAVLRGTFIPSVRFDSTFLATLVAILGTTISPYLWFWQADNEVEEEMAMGRRRLRQRQGASDAELKYMEWDVGIGMFFSNVGMYSLSWRPERRSSRRARRTSRRRWR
jgi:Mn2+/Fe2+ NRAMP family transporter